MQLDILHYHEFVNYIFSLASFFKANFSYGVDFTQLPGSLISETRLRLYKRERIVWPLSCSQSVMALLLWIIVKANSWRVKHC